MQQPVLLLKGEQSLARMHAALCGRPWPTLHATPLHPRRRPSTTGNSFQAAALSRSLPDPASPLGRAPPLQPPPPPSEEQAALAQQLVAQLGLRGFEPAWHRPSPAVLTPSMEELAWLPFGLPQPLLWDSRMGGDGGRAAAVRELVARALKGPLLPVQQQQVLSELEADPKLVHRIGLHPGQLPALVENTPVIAYELLLLLMPSRAIGKYLQVRRCWWCWVLGVLRVGRLFVWRAAMGWDGVGAVCMQKAAMGWGGIDGPRRGLGWSGGLRHS